MKTLFVLITLFSLSVWSSIETQNRNMPQRTLKSLYEKMNNAVNADKAESESLVLKDYNLLVSSGTWWTGANQAEGMWERLAFDRLKELNVIVVYDSPKQDITKIKSKSPNTRLYEYFDQNREFYYWFSQKTLMDAVLIGPNGKILFEGILNSHEKIEQLKSLIKKKEG